MESIRNTLIVLLLAGVVIAAGGYVTFKQQPAELEELEERRELARIRQAEIDELLARKATSEEAADEAVRKWNARYKFIPREMDTSDIVDYLESLTRSGFDAFNIRLESDNNGADISYYTFHVVGAGFYSNLYDVIWHLENNRDFYRVRDVALTATEIYDENPRTGERRRQDMVNFNFKLDAFYGGREGLSTERAELAAIPRELLPAHDPAHNSFYPIVRENLPPNDEQLPEVENAILVSIGDGRAVIEDQRGRHTVHEGDRVYLGRIVLIDPANALVRASLNKGGIVETVDLRMFREGESSER